MKKDKKAHEWKLHINVLIVGMKQKRKLYENAHQWRPCINKSVGIKQKLFFMNMHMNEDHVEMLMTPHCCCNAKQKI